jgi:hypothetical protein
MQIQTAVEYHFTFTRMAGTKEKVVRVGKYGHPHMPRGNINWYSHFGRV